MNYHLLQAVRLTVLLGVISIIQISCDDEPEKDSVAPTIVVTSPTAEDLVRGTVSIIANIEDQAFVEAKVYIDDILIGEVNTSGIDIRWNSNSVSDGTHILKIMALDKQGNTGGIITTIEVMNTLFTLSIPARNISGDLDIWFFLTDDKGNHFGVKKGVDDTELKFETPATYRKGDLFSFHRFAYSSFVGSKSETYNCISYTGLKPGKYSYSASPTSTSSTSTPIGNYTIELSNQNANQTPLIVGQNVGSSYTSVNPMPNKYIYYIPLYKNNVDFLFTLRSYIVNEASVPLYKKIVNASVGEIVSIDAQTLSPFLVNELPLGENVETVNTTTYGVKQPGNYSNKTLLNTHSQVGFFTSINAYHLGNEFPEYEITFSATTSSKTMIYLTRGGLPTSFKRIDADFIDFKYANELIEASLTGTCDYVLFSSSERKKVDDMTSNYSWSIYAGGPGVKYTVPKYPEALISKYPKLAEPVINFKSRGMIDYDAISGYDEYIKYLFQDHAQPLSLRYKNYTSVTFR